MAENKVNLNEPKFTLNAATIVMLLVIAMPVGYIIYANLNKPEPAALEAPAATATTNAAQSDPQGELQKALKAVADNPSYTSYLNLSLWYYKAGSYEDCIKAATKALEFDNKGDAAHNNIAAAYGALGKYDEEIEACNRALAINPNNQLAKNNKAWAEGEKKKAGK